MRPSGWLVVGALVSACGQRAPDPPGLGRSQAGTATSGGAANTTSGGGGGASTSGGGGQGAAAGGGGAIGGPPWLPIGWLEPSVEDYARARAELVEASCCARYCCDDADDPQYQACLRADYLEMVPLIPWLACASRAVRTDAALETWLAWYTEDGRRRAAACSAERCTEGQCDSTSTSTGEPPKLSLPDCPKLHQNFCPDGTTQFLACSGSQECADGYDERNCDRSAVAYLCGGGDRVSWLALCDGQLDCLDGSDELNCSSIDKP